jgi:hypothetical protein
MDQTPYEIWEVILEHAGFFTCVKLGWDNLAEKLYNEKLHGWRPMCVAGNLNVVKWLYKTNKQNIAEPSYNLNSIVALSASCGQVGILKYLKEVGIEYGEDAMSKAIDSGQVEVVKYLVSLGIVYEEYTECVNCLDIGALCMECADDMVDGEYKKYEVGKIYTIDIVVYRGHTELFIYLYESGLECQYGTLCGAAENCYIDIIKYICEVINVGNNEIYAAAQYGHAETIRLIYRYGKYSTSNAMIAAAENGHIEVFKYLYSLFGESTGTAKKIAAANENTNVVECIDKIIKDTLFFSVKMADKNHHSEISKYVLGPAYISIESSSDSDDESSLDDE